MGMATLTQHHGEPSAPRPDMCLHDLFTAQAARDPQAPALIDVEGAGRVVSYRELAMMSDRLATAIRARMPERGGRVGLYLRRGPHVVAAILAVFKAGCSYVPLDPGYPADRVRFMAEDSGLGLVLTEPGADTGAIAPGVAALEVTDALLEEGPATAPGPQSQPPVPVTPEDAAYVIYTSGSSGRPKGVEVPHRAVTALLAACDEVFDLTSDDVWTMFHSHCFDFSVWEIWGALSHGAALIVVPADVARSPEATLRLIADQGVTVLNQVPSVFRYLSRAALADPEAAPELRYVIFGGETLDLQAVRDWRAVNGRTTAFVNMYGVTEATVFSTFHHLTEDDLTREHGTPDPSRTIGRPLPGTTALLVTEDGRRAAPGETGELCLAGDQLAIGYLGQPELTARRYPDMDDQDGLTRRYYRSGDLAIRHPDGTLEFAGRADDQVKINGYRIEAGEVETVLRATEGVGELVVVPADSRIGERILVACYTAAQGIQPAEVTRRLAARARTRLPSFMVPARFVHLPTLPLNASGKTDRRAVAEQLSGA
ncbi:amino acid adenylation domain-containing protein [Streptomyces sp. L2]|uniref:amino acid adenylation domain-containing protein n=1 Tax=Streptomyces sp. L2 TaxID=2162665 RepID=UPI001012853E|nr:amino acid adenylation domain-containing protein [Streptomyces sp. L2]